MPYLNWKEASVQLEHASHEKYESRISLGLPAAELADLIPQLEEIFLRGGYELRIDLPRNWIVFFKLRETESRVLVAHPQTDEWVTTAALDVAHGSKLVGALRALIEGAEAVSVSVNSLAPVGNVSNVELVLQRV